MKLIETSHEQGVCLKFRSELISVSGDINTKGFSSRYVPTLIETCMNIKDCQESTKSLVHNVTGE